MAAVRARQVGPKLDGAYDRDARLPVGGRKACYFPFFMRSHVPVLLMCMCHLWHQRAHISVHDSSVECYQ